MIVSAPTLSRLSMISRLLLVLLVVSATALQAQSSSVPEAPAMKPGDRLHIVIYRNSELTGTYTVTAEGTLLHPLFEEVRVADMPVSQARERMEAALLDEIAAPLFTFEPQYRVYVGGEVRQQGEFFLPETTVGQAIINAGGSTTRNRRQRVKLIR